MTVERVEANGIEIAYESFGDRDGDPLLLVMGLGTQMIGWHDDFCRLLVGRGFRVVRFDNRDTGLSTHLHDAPQPDIMAALAGDVSSAAYTLADLAEDAVALLDALGIDTAHVVGASMGGMIAQEIAIKHPERVLSLTSIMSTPHIAIGPATPEALAVLLAPPVADREAAAERAVQTYRVIGSPGYSMDEAWYRRTAELSFDRGYDPLGVARQLLAISATPDRTEALGGVDVPTLVIHGDSDPLVQPAGGRATAAAIRGARLVEIAGMGHNLPPELWPTVVDAIAENAARAT